MRNKFGIWAATALIFASGTVASSAQDSAEQAKIDVANSFFAYGFHDIAAESYREYLDAYPEGAFATAAWYRLGESEYNARLYDSALAAFGELLKREVDTETRLQATLRRGEILYRLERPDEAVPVLESLVGPDITSDVRAGALYYLGKLRFDGGDPAAAANALQMLIQEIPETPLVPYARYQLGMVLLAQNALDSAAAEFAAVSASDADSTLRMESLFRAAETYDRLGWFDAAEKTYRQLQTDFPESVYAERAAYGYAWALFHAGKFDQSRASAADFAKKYPQSEFVAGMRYLEANCVQQSKDYNAALELYQSVQADFPKSPFAPRAAQKACWVLYLSGKREESKQAVSAFLNAHRDTEHVGDAAFLMGLLLADEGLFEGAFQEFRLVSEKYPNSEFAADALYKMGETLSQLQRMDEAAKVFKAFAQQYPDSPLAEDAILRVGDAKFFAASFQDAVSEYKAILAGAPDPYKEEETLYRLAITYHNMRDFKASTDTFRTILEKFPESRYRAEARVRIGDYLAREGNDPVKAVESYEASLAIEPDGAYAGRAMKGIALTRYETKDLDGAAEIFLRLMKEFPAEKLNEQSYRWTAQYLLDAQRWDDAITALKALLEAFPDYPNPERVRLEIAKCNEFAGRTDEALDQFEVVVKEAPRSSSAVEATYRVARIHEDRKDLDKALKYYEEAASTNTGDTAARARFRQAELLEQRENFEDAAKSYLLVAILFLHQELSPESLIRAGRCFEQANRMDQARKAYEGLVKDFPDSPQAEKAKARLTELG
ncbi:MAG: hypothetical protein AMXMBFR84_36960 [Candidatus Hydrogenedentota bacterium]